MSNVLDQVQTADQQYEMPQVRVGMCLAYYPPNRLDSGKPDICYVKAIHSSQRRITVYIPDVGIKSGVRHLTDPKLKESEVYREEGAWDYSPEHLFVHNQLASLAEQVERLTKEVERLQSRRAKE